MGRSRFGAVWVGQDWVPPQERHTSTPERLRIAQIAPPAESVPPAGYGGTERVIADLVKELTGRGHLVTVFATGDSHVDPATLVRTAPHALRPANQMRAEWPYMMVTLAELASRADEFDVIHAHVEWANILVPDLTTVPTVMTFHGRLDYPWAATSLAHVRAGLIAISNAQASAHPGLAWDSVVHNGLDLRGSPFERRRSDNLVFVGRIAPEKGAVEAIEVARRAGRKLRIAAKIGVTHDERDYFEGVFRPAMERADVEFLGELSGSDRDRLLCESYATLVPGIWPEPFGLVTIESLACGTPVIARRVGALPEIVREGVDGFFGDDEAAMAFRVEQIASLDRAAIRESVLDRFSAVRMADGYEAAYGRAVARAAGARGGVRRSPAAARSGS